MTHDMVDQPASPAVLGRHLGLGRVDQISFAVKNMQDALPYYTAMFGRFDVRTVEFGVDNTRYRGRPCSASLVLAIARSGDVEIELVEVSRGDAPAAEHIRRHGEGIHHIRFSVDDVVAKTAELNAEGFETVLAGTSARGIVFAYLEAPERYGHTQFELVQPLSVETATAARSIGE